jgi:ABC-type branched-subunit amino acid transport system substrate-binding protein
MNIFLCVTILCSSFGCAQAVQSTAAPQKFVLHKKNSANQPATKKVQLRLKKGAMSQLNTGTSEGGAQVSFLIAFPETGDMDVVGKQLLDGAMFCVGELKNQMSAAPVKLSFAGNVNQFSSEAVSQIVTLASKAPVVVGCVGTETLVHLYAHPHMKQAQYLFPVEGSSVIRSKNNPASIFYRPTYEQELRALVSYVIKYKLKEKIAIFYEAGLWGRTLMNDLMKILNELNVKPVITAQYPQHTVEVDRAVKTIAQAMPNVIFCLAKPRPAYKFIKQVVDHGMHATMFVGPSPLISIQHLLKNARGIDIVTTSVVPPETSEIPLIKKYKELFAKRFSFKRSNPFYLEAFLYTELLAEAVKSVPDAAHNPALLVQYFAQMRDRDFMGLPLSFNPLTRGLCKKVWISPGVGASWIEINLP